VPESIVERSLAARPEDLDWQRAYDRASVDRFLEAVERERARLQEGIDAARDGLAAVQAARRASDETVKAEIGGLVFAAREELANLEAEHAKVVAIIRGAAETEATRVIAAAEREVEAIRASITSLTGADDGMEQPSSHASGWVDAR
jgi:cell division septum initiation protein DivIVA